MFSIRRCNHEDEEDLFALLRSEGDAWSDYHSAEGAEKYKTALRNSVVYVVREDGFLCAHIRLRDDDGFGVYVYDLLVHKDFRGKNYGKRLLEHARKEFSGTPMHIMSDADGYYEKLGCQRAGTVFEV